MKSITDILAKANIMPGTQLYTPIVGDVSFVNMFPTIENSDMIAVSTPEGGMLYFDEYGRYNSKGECLLFPCNAVREWNEADYIGQCINIEAIAFTAFDKVLVRNLEDAPWKPSWYQYYDAEMKDYANRPHLCGDRHWKYCIPYNKDTEYLVGKALPAQIKQEN